MANSSSTATGVAGKSYPYPFPSEPPALVAGLVQHGLLSASIQVRILSLVDETGSASVGDIIAQLSEHPDPVGAILVMVNLNILVVAVDGVLDANSVVRRADPEPDPLGSAGRVPNLSGGSVGAPITPLAEASVPAGLERLEITPFAPQVVVGAGEARRAFAHLADQRQPGIYGLMSGGSASIYIGMGRDVGARVAGGQQPIEAIDTIFVITDANCNLTTDDAKVAERMLWSRVAACRERKLVNSVPDGAPIEAQRYCELDAFIAQACLGLRHQGILFTSGAARTVLAGPRYEPGRVGPLRLLNTIPDGEILELRFGGGLIALAARQAADRWVLLQGSDVRLDTVVSANASTRYLRSAWLHSGLLAVAPDAMSYVVKRDLAFASGSAVAQFCIGAKGKGLAGWQPIDPDGGYDPETAALIAA